MKQKSVVLLVLLLVATATGYVAWSLLETETPSEQIGAVDPIDTPDVPTPTPTKTPKALPDPLVPPEEAPIEDEPEEGAVTAAYGMVISPNGTPVRDAIVTLCRRRGNNPVALGPLRRVRPPVTTGKDGTFRFEKLEGGKGYSIVVEHGAYSKLEVPGLVLPADVETKLGDIMLKSGAEIGGVVARVDGKAVEGAQVRVVPSGGSIRPLMDRAPAKVVLTDEHGVYKVRNLTPGTYDVLVMTREYRQGQRLNVFVTTPGATAKVDFALEPGVTISGRVSDPLGQPIEGAAVEVQDQALGNHLMTIALSDSEGRFRATGLGPGKYRLRATREGYSEAVAADVPGGRADVGLTMEQNAAITGFVLDGDTNEPIKSFGLILVMCEKNGVETEPLRPMQSFQRTKDGSFTIEDVPPGHYNLQGFANEFAPGWSELITIARDHVHNVRVVLGKGGSISGAVVDAKGQPVPGATVRLLDNAYVEAPFARLLHGAMSQFASSHADDSGFYSFKFLGPGVYQVQASSSGRATASVHGVSVEAGKDTRAEPVVLTEGGSVIGTVVDESGLPVPNAKVSLLAENGTSFETQSANDGTYGFRHFRPGLYTLAAQPPATDPNAGNIFAMVVTSLRSNQKVTLVEGQEQRVDVLLRKS